MRVKICGITNYKDAEAAVENGADALGFIFYKGSRRYIEPEKVRAIVDKLPVFLLKVGVFVDESVDEVNRIAKTAGLNALQLHGSETYEYVQRINLPVIKAFRVNDDFDYSLLDSFPGCSYLLDAYDPNQPGGTGLKFDWDKIPHNLRDKIILAGGISVDNIEYIYNKIKPQAIDLSSSVEITPGKKDHKKLIKLLELLKKLK